MSVPDDNESIGTRVTLTDVDFQQMFATQVKADDTQQGVIDMTTKGGHNGN